MFGKKSVDTDRNNLVLRIKKITSDLNSDSSNLAASSEEAASATAGISESLQKISYDTTLQEKETGDCANQIAIISGNIGELSSSIDSMNQISEKVSEYEVKTKNSLRTLLADTSEANLASKRIATAIEKADGATKQISQVLSKINDIARKTKLVSINASIEAARAGESGRGFEVVASEIKRLASLSEELVSNISDSISNIQKESSNAVSEVSSTSAIFRNQIQTLNEAQKLYGLLSEGIISLSGEAKNVSDSSVSIMEHKDNITEIINQLHQSADKNAKIVQSITASIEEQAEAMNQIANSAQNLNDITKELSSITDEIKVEK